MEAVAIAMVLAVLGVICLWGKRQPATLEEQLWANVAVRLGARRTK